MQTAVRSAYGCEIGASNLFEMEHNEPKVVFVAIMREIASHTDRRFAGA
jgi:hypothetical protein